MVALKLRFTPQVLEAKRIIAAGTLGDLYYVETVADRRRGNPGGSFIKQATAGFGAVADIGVYALDTALYLMGHPKPVAVSAITSNELSRGSDPVLTGWNANVKDTEVEDFAAAWVRFDNGIRMVFKTCWCMHLDTLGGTFLLGTKAGLRIGVSEVTSPKPGVTLYRDEFGALPPAHRTAGSRDDRETALWRPVHLPPRRICGAPLRRLGRGRFDDGAVAGQ